MKARIFISWSGDRSRQLGEVLSDWIGNVIQRTETYFSQDMEKGVRWGEDIARALANCQVGIICLTPENLSSSWIMFEAGALSKTLETARVSPLLFEVAPTDVTGPLAQFQATRLEKPEVRRLMQMINGQLGEEALEATGLERAIEVWWPQLEAGVARVKGANLSVYSAPMRPERDLLLEVLELLRIVTNAQARPEISVSLLRDLVGSYLRLTEACKNDDGSVRLVEELLELLAPIEVVVSMLEVSTPVRTRLMADLDAARRTLRKAQVVSAREADSLERNPDDEEVPF